MKVKILLIILLTCSLLYSKKNESNTYKVYWAISESDLATIKELQEKGVDLSLPQQNNYYSHISPFYDMRSINNYHESIYKERIKNYYDLMPKDNPQQIKIPRFHKYIPIPINYFLHPTLKKIPNAYARTPLEIAVILSEIEIIKYFVEECNLHVENRNHGQSLTEIAIEYGHLDILKYLIENNMYIHFPTALFKALEFKHKEIAKYLLDNYPVDVNYISNRGNSLLNAAISLQDLDYIHYIFNEKGFKTPKDEHAIELILNKAYFTDQDSILFHLIETYNLPITNGWDYSLLVNLYKKGDYVMFKYLVENGADVNIRSKKEQYTLLHKWVEDPKKSLEITKFLYNETNYDFYANDITGKNLIMSFAHKGYFEACKYLIENLNFDLNAQSLDGRNILTYAISNRTNEKNKYKFVEYLIEKGIDVNSKTNDLDTLRQAYLDGLHSKKGYFDKAQKPIIAASIYSNKKMIKLLLDNGADINAEDFFGNTALDLVNGFFRKFFLKLKGAEYGNNLFAAVKDDNFSDVKRIIEKGIDVNKQNLSGETALSYARSLKTAEFLVQNGASVVELKFKHNSIFKKQILEKIENNTGKNISSDLLINSAIANNDINEVMKFIDSGYDINDTNYLNQNPLHMAARMNNLEIIDSLLTYGAERMLLPQIITSPPIDSTTINHLDKKKVKFTVQNNTNNNYQRYLKVPEIEISMRSSFEEILSHFEKKYINKDSLDILDETTFEKDHSILVRKFFSIYRDDERGIKLSEDNINLTQKDINGISIYFISFQRKYNYNRNSKFVLEYAKEDYSAIDYNGVNIFMHAAQTLPLEDFKELMKNYCFDINYKDFDSRTILDYAQYAHFRHGQDYKDNFWEIVNYLCELGAKRGTGVEHIPPKWD